MTCPRPVRALLLFSILTVAAVQPDAAQQEKAPPPEPQPPAQQPAAPESAPPGGADQQNQQPVFRGGINFVRVDVIVDDRKGQPVLDLSQADFEVIEDGKPQSVEQFTLVKVDGNPRPGAPPPSEIRTRNDEELIANREDIRVFVFFFDDYHVRRANAF